MKTIKLIILMGISFSFCLKSQQNDFKSLFNEKDLAGWEVLNGTAPFTVENEEIVGTYVTGTPNTFLCTKKKYSDFILTFNAKFGDGNSGVMFRAQSNAEYKDGRVHGYQMEMDPSIRSWTGGIYDEARRGWLYCMEYNQEGKKAFKKGEWNTYRIEAIGNRLRTFVNDIPMSDLIDDVDAEGFIGLQVHSISPGEQEGEQARFKNIMICTSNLEKHKTTDAKKIAQVSFLTNQLSKREKAEGWKMLWNGETTIGWRGAKLKNFPEKGWHIKNGVLTVEDAKGEESGNGGDIVTIDKYKNFILELDFKITKGANSGIKYFVDTELNKGKGSSIGCEYQILDDQHHPDAKMGVNGNRTLASLYDLIPANAQNFNPDLPNKKRVNKYGWNRAKIIVNGNDVEHYLNGILVVKYNRHGEQWREQVAESKYKIWPGFGEAAKGNILLQDHGNEVHFKNIKIKTL